MYRVVTSYAFTGSYYLTEWLLYCRVERACLHTARTFSFRRFSKRNTKTFGLGYKVLRCFLMLLVLRQTPPVVHYIATTPTPSSLLGRV